MNDLVPQIYLVSWGFRGHDENHRAFLELSHAEVYARSLLINGEESRICTVEIGSAHDDYYPLTDLDYGIGSQ